MKFEDAIDAYQGKSMSHVHPDEQAAALGIRRHIWSSSLRSTLTKRSMTWRRSAVQRSHRLAAFPEG